MKVLTKNDLKRMNDEQHEDFVLINVLPPEYFNKKHIHASINIPNESPDFVETVRKAVGSKERKIVVYCANFECDLSTKAAKKLDEAGFTQVFDYEGGTKDWFDERSQAAA